MILKALELKAFTIESLDSNFQLRSAILRVCPDFVIVALNEIFAPVSIFFILACLNAVCVGGEPTLGYVFGATTKEGRKT